MSKVAVVILTFNEEVHIARAIESVSGFASEIVVVDSFSTDRTVEICESAGARVYQNPFVNQAKQFQWALDNVEFESSWIMRLDADEVISAELSEEIKLKLPKLPEDVVGINLKRKHVFLGRWIKHGGRYPVVLMRLWRRGCARVEDRWMDEHIVVHGGRTVTFVSPFSDDNLNDLSFFTRKHDSYSTREAVDVICSRYGLTTSKEVILSSPQARLKRHIKEGIYNRIPYPAASFIYFLFRYTVQLGFLDGREGLIYHFLQGFWYRFLVGSKVFELERSIKRFDTVEGRRRELSRLTRLPL